MATSGNRTIKIRDGFGNELEVGKVVEDMLLIARNRSKHFFAKYNGWAIDKLVAEGLTDVKTFILRDFDSRFTYVISREDFLKKATPISNHGHREQLVVEEGEWEKKTV